MTQLDHLDKIHPDLVSDNWMLFRNSGGDSAIFKAVAMGCRDI